MKMKKLLILLITILPIVANAQYVKSIDIIKAADMVLDVNIFGTAHTVLAMHNLPVNEDATDEFARRFSKNSSEYRKYLATNAFIYWPALQRSPKTMLLGRLTAFGPNESDIEELYFSLGDSYRDKFMSDLVLFGYQKKSSQTKKDPDFGVSYLETIYQKENHVCTIKNTGNVFQVTFSREVREESAEERIISEQCRRFIRLHGVDGAKPYNLTDLSAPYEIPAVVDIQFPPENTIVDISKDVLCKNPEPINRTTELTISSGGNKSVDTYNEKVLALYKWIDPYIKVKNVSKVNFPRYGKGFVVGDSYDLHMRESEEEYDSCTVSFKVKCKGTTVHNAEFNVKNQKDVEAKLASVYGNSDLLTSIWSSFPRNYMFRSTSSGNTYMINVHIYRRKITYTLDNKSATYMLPFVYIWDDPIKK